MDGSFPTVATLALVLSVVSLGWQVLRAWWDRPVLMVTGDLFYRIAPDTELTIRTMDTSVGEVEYIDTRDAPMGWQATITVTNVGDRSVTITDAGWWYSPGTHWEDIERAPGMEDRFPLRLEPHDQVRLAGHIADDGEAWRYGNPPLEMDTPGGKMPAARPFIDYVRRPWRWRLRKRPGVTRLYAPTVPVDRSGL